MAAFTYTLPNDILDASLNVILIAGNYRVQDKQLTLLAGKEVHISIQRINLATFFVEDMTFVVTQADLNTMTNSLTTGKPFADELNDLIWGWLSAKEKAQMLIGRQAIADELLPEMTQV